MNALPFRLMALVVGTAHLMTGVAAAQNDDWQPLGEGVNDTIRALTVHNGDLIAGGYFTSAGGQPASRIARWDGSDWHAIGDGMGTPVSALATYGNDLVAAAGTPVARWTGTSWQPMGTLPSGVAAFEVFGGQLIAGTMNYLRPYLWTGSGWSAFEPHTNLLGSVLALKVHNAQLYVAGYTFLPGGHISRWNPSGSNKWVDVHEPGGGPNNTVTALTSHAGDLIAGGWFTSVGGIQARGIARWDGSSWHPFGAGVGNVHALTVYNNELIAGGSFGSEFHPPSKIARWDGTAWEQVGSGFKVLPVNALTVYNGQLIAGGSFVQTGATTAVSRIAAYGTPYNTPVGSDVEVPAEPDDDTEVSIEFEEVSEAGHTTVTAEDRDPDHDPPAGSQPGLLDNVYRIETTAIYHGDIRLCFTIKDNRFTNEERVRLFHSPMGEEWFDVTTSSVALITGERMICGEVSSFSYFGLFEVYDPPVAVCNAFVTSDPANSGSTIHVPDGASVTLDGTGSFDPAGLLLGYQWDVAGVALDDPASAIASGIFPLGIHTATLTVTNSLGGFDTCDVTVHVQELDPPEVMIWTDVAALWPPNHTMRPVQVVVTGVGAAPFKVLLRSSEPDNAQGNGDGNTTGDCHGHDGFAAPVDITGEFVWDPAWGDAGAWVTTIQVRAERAGSGNGRAYTFEVEALDSFNNISKSSIVVVVPKSLGRSGH